MKYKKSKEYTIASQIIPTNIPKKGGGYLDFGVIKNKIVEAVYEVKSQDYILDRGFGINKALREVCNDKHHIKSFITQEMVKYIMAHLKLKVI